MLIQRLFVMKWTTFALCFFTNIFFTQQVSPPVGIVQTSYLESEPAKPYLCTDYGCNEINEDFLRLFEEIRSNEDYSKIKQIFQDYLDYHTEEDMFNSGDYKSMEKRGPYYTTIKNPPCDYCNGKEHKLNLNGQVYFPDNITSVKCQSNRKCGDENNYNCIAIKRNVTLLTAKHQRPEFRKELKQLKNIQLKTPTDFFQPIHRLYNIQNVEVTVKCVCLCSHSHCE